ncbi:MAG: sulfotransferase [Chloroflexi bacterium]|nr:sulfotransferase [Chloroflexota bacterium]
MLIGQTMTYSTGLHRALSRRMGKFIAPIWPGKIKDVTFIVGCPRSGTTIFGEILGQHPDFVYLFEPRYIWLHQKPSRNVWGMDASGKLHLDESDLDSQEQKRLAQWFHFALTLSGRRRLVEKLPLNVFRLRWIHAMFPQAKFIHIIRHGRDVALSLEKLIAKRFPPSYWETHWNYLMFEDYASHIPEFYECLAQVRQQPDNYPRALLVWLCSVWEGQQAGHEIGSQHYTEIRYEELIADPEAQLAKLFAFLSEPIDANTIAYAKDSLHPGSLHKVDPSPQITAAVASDMLAKLGYNS